MNFLTPCFGFFVNFHDGADYFFNPFVEEIYRGNPGTHDCYIIFAVTIGIGLKVLVDTPHKNHIGFVFA